MSEFKNPEAELLWIIQELIADKWLKIDHRLATGCRCMGCYSWQVTDSDVNDKEIMIAEDDDFEPAIRQAWAKVGKE